MKPDVRDLLQGARIGSADVIRDALASGIAPNEKGRAGMSALHFIASEGHADCVHLLIDAAADINQRDDQGRSPLHHAAGNGRLETLRLLLHFHAVVDPTDDLNWTPLGLAITQSRDECVYVLTSAGADPSIVERHHPTALRKAGSEVLRAIKDGERVAHSSALANLVATNPARPSRKTSL